MELQLEGLPSSTTTEDNTLRRSSSAPLISGLGWAGLRYWRRPARAGKGGKSCKKVTYNSIPTSWLIEVLQVSPLLLVTGRSHSQPGGGGEGGRAGCRARAQMKRDVLFWQFSRIQDPKATIIWCGARLSLTSPHLSPTPLKKLCTPHPRLQICNDCNFCHSLIYFVTSDLHLSTLRVGMVGK